MAGWWRAQALEQFDDRCGQAGPVLGVGELNPGVVPGLAYLRSRRFGAQAHRDEFQIEVGEGVPDRVEQQRALPALAQAQRSPRPGFVGLAQRRTPQPAPDAGRRPPLDQQAALGIVDEQDVRAAQRARAARPGRGNLRYAILDPRDAVRSHRAGGALRRARAAHGAAQIHERLRVVGEPRPRQPGLGQRP